MNMPATIMTRAATPRDVKNRASANIEALLDGNEDARLAFAEYLAEEGELGDVADMRLNMTIEQLVAAQLSRPNGRALAKVWADALAEDQVEAADFQVPA